MNMIETPPGAKELAAVAANWKWMMGLGLLMLLLGVIGLAMAGALTIITVIWFGVLALFAGVAQLIDAFRYPGWKSTLAHVLMGVLYLVVGVIMIALPVQSAFWLTLLIGATFVATGLFRIVMAYQMNAGPVSWGLGISGAVSVVLGVLIYTIVDLPDPAAFATAEGASTWFQSWGWVIGLFVALEFIVHGIALVGLAFAAKSIDEGTDGGAGSGTTGSGTTGTTA